MHWRPCNHHRLIFQPTQDLLNIRRIFLMNTPLSNAEKSRKLPWALVGDSFNVVYVYLAMGGPVFLLFLDHLKLDKSQIGLLLSLISFGGLIAIFAGPLASRLGVRRVFLACFALRKFILAGLILSPWVISQYGLQAGFIYTAIVLGLFAFCRSFGESANMIWAHEYIPANKRGKFTALQTIVIMVVGAITIAIAGWFLGKEPETWKFQILFAIAFFFGITMVFCYARLPGGQPLPPEQHEDQRWSRYLEPLRDKRFRMFLTAHAFVNIGWCMMTPFLPLFYRDEVGLRADQVVTVDAVFMVAQLMVCFLWGWTADRYGGKPQMVLNLALLILFPIALMLVPRHTPVSTLSVWGVVFVLGLVMPGWSIGFGRVLNVDLIPAEKKMTYLVIYMTSTAALVGVCPLLAGYILDHLPVIDYTWGWFHIDQYTPFFVFCVLTFIVAVALMWRIPTGAQLPVTSFAGMFMQGNPLAAMHAIISYQYAGHEAKRVISVERLGQTNSPLGVEELISSLFDPSFNVRYEAIVSVARTRQNPRLTQAMIQVLTQGSPELRGAAAWALGRMGDKDAIPALVQQLDSPYLMLRSRAARALGTLGHREAAAKILSMFHEEKDPAIAVAYVTALAALGESEVASQMLEFLDEAEDQNIRQETALAIASLLSRDVPAMRLWRRMQSEPGDTLGGILLGINKRLCHRAVTHAPQAEIQKTVDQCTRLLAMEMFEPGADMLLQIINQTRWEAYETLAQIVLKHAGEALEAHGHARIEYLFLAVHTLHVGVTPQARTLASTRSESSPLGPGPLPNDLPR